MEKCLECGKVLLDKTRKFCSIDCFVNYERKHNKRYAEKKEIDDSPFNPRFWNTENANEDEKLDDLNKQLRDTVKDDYDIE